MTPVEAVKDLERRIDAAPITFDAGLERTCVSAGVLLMELMALLELMRTCVALGSNQLDVEQIQRALTVARTKAEERLTKG